MLTHSIGVALVDRDILNRAFFEARLKVNRACRHVHEAQYLFSAYAKADFYKITNDVDPQTGNQIVKVVTAPIHPDLVLAIGDAFHCLSASLDYISSGLMRAKTGNATRVTFPSDESRNGLRKSFMRPGPNKRSPPNRRIMEAFPLIAFNLLTVIQSYKGGKFGIWEIRKADNIDKHNLIIPSVTITEITGVDLVDEVRNNTVSNMTIRVGAGGIVNAISYGGDTTLKFKNKGQASVGIIFPESAEIFGGDPVFPTLIQCSQMTHQVINLLETVANRYL
jgi:hypothetical protein